MSPDRVRRAAAAAWSAPLMGVAAFPLVRKLSGNFEAEVVLGAFTVFGAIATLSAFAGRAHLGRRDLAQAIFGLVLNGLLVTLRVVSLRRRQGW